MVTLGKFPVGLCISYRYQFTQGTDCKIYNETGKSCIIVVSRDVKRVFYRVK